MKLILLSAIITTLGQFFLKLGMNQNANFLNHGLKIKELIKVFAQPFIIIGMSLFFIASITWLKVLSSINLSFAYPIVVALNFILITSISILFLSEPISFNKLVGTIGIFVSIALMSL